PLLGQVRQGGALPVPHALEPRRPLLLVRHSRPEALRRGEAGKWLETPEGWARATLLVQTLREPPARGSLRESVLILYVLRKEHVEHARLRALAQAIIHQEKGVEAFDAYQKVAFPWLTTQKRREADEHIRRLRDEVMRGPLTIRPLWETRPMRSR